MVKNDQIRPIIEFIAMHPKLTHGFFTLSGVDQRQLYDAYDMQDIRRLHG